MTAITRRRIAAAAGVLTLSGLLGVAVAVPGPYQDGKTAMTQKAMPHPWDSAKLTQWEEGTPRPWDSIKLDSTAHPYMDITLTSVQRTVPPPFEDG